MSNCPSSFFDSAAYCRALLMLALKVARDGLKVSKQPGFENILKWGYARAMRDIQQWTPGGRTFNVGVPKQATDDFGLKQLQAKKRDVIDFLNMVTSTKTKTLWGADYELSGYFDSSAITLSTQKEEQVLDNIINTPIVMNQDLKGLSLSDSLSKFDLSLGSGDFGPALSSLSRKLINSPINNLLD